MEPRPEQLDPYQPSLCTCSRGTQEEHLCSAYSALPSTAPVGIWLRWEKLLEQQELQDAGLAKPQAQGLGCSEKGQDRLKARSTREVMNLSS